jgi:NTE family protein
MKKIGLVLGAGGGRGLAHIGVLEVLLENNIKPDYIIGSSVGALIGALFCKTQDIQQVQQTLIDFNWKELSSLLNLDIRKGVVNGEKFRKKLNFQKATFEDLDIPLEIVTTRLDTAEAVYINSGDLAEAIQASVAFPMFIEPLEKDNVIYWDGGLSDPLPVERAKDKSDIVIAVNLDTYFYSLQKASPIQAVKSLQYHMALRASQQADIILEPRLDKEDNSILSLNAFIKKDRGQEIIAIGRRSVQEKIEDIKKRLDKFN